MADGTRRAGNRHRSARLLWPVGAMLLSANLATLLALFGDRWWLFELTTHFPVQFAAAQVVGLFYFAARRRLPLILFTLPFLAINLAVIAPYYLPGRAEAASAASAGSQSLRVMTLNLLVQNDRIDLVERAILEEDPDVILFTEATLLWYQRLVGIRKLYPYEIRRIARRRHAVLLVSRFPLHEGRALRSGASGRTILSASVCPGGERCLTILGAHPLRPGDASTSTLRNEQLLEMAALAARQPGGRVVMLGDFNITPYSPVFPEILAAGRLRDSALGFTPQTTWLSRFPLFGLPIDHILVGHGVTVRDRRIGPDVGSDHFPVIADLAF